jgi:transcriptional regulator with XRE-family HTH domain
LPTKAEIIAGELRAHRAKKKVSQREVAQAIGANNSTVGAWEQRAGVSLEDAWKLADYYGVSLDELAGRSR